MIKCPINAWKKCSPSLVLGTIQTKATLRLCPLSIRQYILKKTKIKILGINFKRNKSPSLRGNMKKQSRHDSRHRKLRTHIFKPKQEAENANWDISCKIVSSKAPHTAPPTGSLVFNYWGHSHWNHYKWI